jgi:hypothetical protein
MKMRRPGNSEIMARVAEVYVRLLDEGVDAWRPVRAEEIGNGICKLLEQPYERDVETWEFEPNDVVVCESIEADSGPFLGGTRLKS